jgi:hypothetical protein
VRSYAFWAGRSWGRGRGRESGRNPQERDRRWVIRGGKSSHRVGSICCDVGDALQLNSNYESIIMTKLMQNKSMEKTNFFIALDIVIRCF